MKMVKSLLLGSAAGLVAIAGAQAADLPVKAKAVEYVKVCSLYGAGFYYIPGTDTCLKVGGYVRTEVNINAKGSFAPGGELAGIDAINDRNDNAYAWRTRFVWTMDARSQTAYGTLRSYGKVGIQWTTGDSQLAGSGAVAYFEQAYIQFAGFTAGAAPSMYDFYSFAMHSYQSNIIGSDQGGAGQPLLAYTAAFGNGFSATISVEDSSKRRRGVFEANTTPAVGTNPGASSWYALAGATPQDETAGVSVPDFTANLNLTQAWGRAQISAAAHLNQGDYYGISTATAINNETNLNGHPGDKWGYAVQAGLILNLPTAKGDTFAIQAGWAKGAMGYITGPLSATGAGTLQRYSSNASWGGGQVVDAVFSSVGQAPGGATAGALELTTGYAIQAGIEHYWQPNLRTSLYGGYMSVNYNAAASTAVCAAPAGVFTPVGCNPDFKLWQVGSRTVWNPVANLELGVDLLYTKVDVANFAGVAFNANGTRPASAGNVNDQSIFSAIVRAQRNFWP